ncbi:MAG TPA: helix-turn-helix transcriptional regulator [Pyrinomonadaceae bacterium]|jgi:transcriptional regulator with XRE-family HTH domain|nr:helix-turn-helix transcriptional regulator [Pyrinomonadaceae bacterium]
MGNKRRPRPKRLAAKLLAIRGQLNLTQEQMAERLGKIPSPPDGAMISRYERDEREPSLFALLAYARLVGVAVDVLIDDKLNLPK